MNFFDQVYFDNTIKLYCFVLGTISALLLFRKFLSKYVASLLFVMVKSIWKNIDKKSFTDLVLTPLQRFLILSISIFAIDKLNFPSDLYFSIYGHNIHEVLNKIGIGLIIISFIGVILRSIDFMAVILGKRASLTPGKGDDQLVVFFRDFLKVIVGIIGILLIIKACFNQNIGNLLTGLSIVGAALALAAKESLENLIASFIIFFDKPFAAGDSLKLTTVSGKVEKIGLRSTRIRTAEKTLVTVPNKQMVDSIVDNLSLRTKRRVEIKIELSVKTPVENVKAFMTQLKALFQSKAPAILSFNVFFNEFNKNGMVIYIEYFTPHTSLQQLDVLKEEINIAIKTIMDDGNLSFVEPK